VSALTESVTKLRVELAAAEQSRDTYRRELAAEEPQLPMGRATRYSDSVVDVQARLESQKKHLDDILSRYTEVHPDVTSTRRVIGQLEAEAQERRAAEDREMAGRGKTGKAATSPIYQKLRISLAETEAQVAALRSQLAAQQRQLDEVRSLAGRVPQAEAELAQLNRDYDVIRKNYDVMVARRESASLGVKLDESSQLADFRVIEPPRVSHSPVFPSRLQLALMAVLVCAAAGIAAAVAVDLVWPTFDDASALRLSSDRPVLGTVSKLVPPQGQRAQRAAMWRFAAAFAVLMALQATWVAWIAFKTHLQ
jgi:polysaccharide chain length determinant protein (PEP-CTERM system associated)